MAHVVTRESKASLAHLGVRETRGRRHPQPRHAYRSEFQRDRDRIVHAHAFRRLENKTQVFTRRYSDHFRNRLTHTIEVAQISRTIATALGLNVDLAETLALAHDIGHGPFGHAGEKALDALMRAENLSFDHNLHALRIVEDFESRYADFRGLNLTFEVREGIVKHSSDYSPAEHPELGEYLLDERPPLEAQLIDLTDEIAYNTADLDDGHEARILSMAAMRAGVGLFDRCYHEAERNHPQTTERLLFNEAVRRVVDALVTDLIRNTTAQAMERGLDSLAEVRACKERIAGLSPHMESERRQMKEFLYRNLYYSRELAEEKEMAERVVSELFAHWMAHPEALPESYHGNLAKEPRPRVICDYIAGMTDNYILKQHQQMLQRG